MKNKLPEHIEKFIQDAKKSQGKSVYEMTLDEFRSMCDEMTPEHNRCSYNVCTEDKRIRSRNGTVPIRIYTPKIPREGKRPGMIYLLGGGFVAGTLEHQDLHCRIISEKANSVVIAVCYRLAPENKYPVGLHDAEDTTRWVLTHAGELGIKERDCSIIGYSSGGTFAATIANKKEFRFSKLVLIAPCLDFARTCHSHEEFEEGVMLDKQDLDWHWQHYLPSGADLKNPVLSPFYQEIIGTHPSTLIITFQFCPFRDEGHKYAETLSRAGVFVREIRYEGLHLMFSLSAARNFNENNPIYGVCNFLGSKNKSTNKV